MISFVVFSLKRAWQGFWRNALMSLAATATMVPSGWNTWVMPTLRPMRPIVCWLITS